MRSIPTDLLRAFIAVIDLRGYTRAGERLGRTQPAISLQMKKLQDLLEARLFVKDGSDGQLTEAGEIVASYARQILALNDSMMLRLANRDTRGKLRLGIPTDYADHFLPRLLSGLQLDRSGPTFEVVCDLSHELLRLLRAGLLDIVVAMTPDGPAEGVFMTWSERLTWVGGAESTPDSLTDPLRIVCYPEGCLYRRNMLTALQREGRAFDVVYASPSLAGIEAAVSTNFGITVLARRILPDKLVALGAEYKLPHLADVVVGIYVNDTRRSTAVHSFAARLADMFVAGADMG